MAENLQAVRDLIALYRDRINKYPVVLSILYDADLLPEQVSTVQSAISMASIVEAYEAGMADATPPQ